MKSQINKHSITPSGFFGNSTKNIVELENFVTEKEHKRLYDFAQSMTMFDEVGESQYNENGVCIYDAKYWANRVAGESVLRAQDAEIPKIIRLMMKRLKTVVDDFFNVDAVSTSPTIVRWYVGQEQKPHADKELHEGPDAGKPNNFPYYDIASLFYLNDNYSGGELYFPNQGIQFKPKSRAAYFFPGDKEYIHGVTKVENGIRYTCPFFWTIMKHRGEKNA